MLLGTQPVAVPPPPNFRPVEGRITFVEQIGSIGPGTGKSLAQVAGLRFEAQVKAELLARYAPDLSRGPRFRFVDSIGAARVCEPDAIVVRKNFVLLFEVKAQHTPDAWHQIRHLYEPVLAAFYLRDVVPVEVVKSYDGYTPFPEQTHVVFSLDELDDWVPDFKKNSAQFAVLLWPQRNAKRR